MFDLTNAFFLLSLLADISALSYQTVVVKAGTFVNLTCPGVSELSLISALEWRCQGCNVGAAGPAGAGGRSATSSESSAPLKLVEYANNAAVVWHNSERMSLDAQSYALQFNPVRHYDHGEYSCLVNERRRPDAVVHLVVQGKSPTVSLQLHLCRVDERVKRD